jgi:formylglycine-generating enzyme required for sulfatase activity
LVWGSGWLDGPSTVRAAYRYSELEGMRNFQTSFRVVRDL